MAQLTAQDVVEKRFQSVKFREGYDQIEVDEFLDEVVATIHALTVENSELKAQLNDCNQRVAAMADGQAPVAAVEEVAVAEVVPEPAPEPEPEPEPAPPAPAVPASDPEAAASMLALAQRLHDEYVSDGRSEGERLVAEAQAEGESIINRAENERRDILGKLKKEKNSLEDSINNLRAFESDYRGSISSHLEKLLSEVNTSPEAN